jgi:intracellular multiplication protein IcmL
MAEDELRIVRLKDDFYRDGDYKIFIALAMVLAFIIVLTTTSVFLHRQKPKPITFYTDDDWRLFPPVPLDNPYLPDADVLQWVSKVIPAAFSYDFSRYDQEIAAAKINFSGDAWNEMSGLINKYANQTSLQNTHGIVNTTVTGAPVFENRGIPSNGKLAGRYVWQVHLPINIHYSNDVKSNDTALELTMLVARIPTLESLSGIIIDDVNVTAGEGGQVPTNG